MENMADKCASLDLDEEFVNEWKNEWMNERINEWMNDWVLMRLMKDVRIGRFAHQTFMWPTDQRDRRTNMTSYWSARTHLRRTRRAKRKEWRSGDDVSLHTHHSHCCCCCWGFFSWSKEEERGRGICRSYLVTVLSVVYPYQTSTSKSRSFVIMRNTFKSMLRQILGHKWRRIIS